MYYVRTYYRALIIVVLACALVTIVIPVGMRLDVSGDIYESADGVPQAEVAIVPGAGVINGKPTQVLAARADTAIQLYFKHKVSKILVTGDNGALSHDEVTPVRKYLLDAGVAPQDIFLDHAGFDTYSSMYRAIVVFDATSAIIVTQNFHLPRALYIAHKLGLEAYGVEAEGSGGSTYDYLREIPASGKAVWDLLVRREPKYLGMPYPLTGDGQPTWY